MRTSTPRQTGRPPGRWPVTTVSVLTVTTALTVLQYPFPQVRRQVPDLVIARPIGHQPPGP